MNYKAYFTDIDDVEYTLEIFTTEGGSSQYELTLAGDPIIVTTKSDGLFTPIKCQSCTINIVTDGGLFDLYAINPQEVKVLIYKRSNNEVVFRGYATPMQYGQDWTTKDVLSLECVDIISSLKARHYVQMGQIKGYKSADVLISYLLSCTEDPNSDELYNVIRWYWPKHNFKNLNTYDFYNTAEMLSAIKFNEANFFDDDDRQTPWTCYAVLEEICRFFNVSLVTYKGEYYFIDYLYAATDAYQTYDFWKYDLDLNVQSAARTKNVTLNMADYAGGTASIQMPELYNFVSVNSNRYDVEEICSDIMDHKEYHISITKERNFGSGLQVWTHTKEGWFKDTVTQKWVYKTFCRLNQQKSRWTHHWYRPMQTTVNGTTHNLYEVGNYYDGDTYDLEMQNPQVLGFYNLPENKWINTIGATFVHYTSLDSLANKPTKLDWNDVIMFQTTHPTINTVGGQANYMLFKYGNMWDGTLEKVALTYTSDYELNFSPEQGTSWIVFDGKLWYQHNESAGDPEIYPTCGYFNKKECRQAMFPIEDVTDREPFVQQIWYGSDVIQFSREARWLYDPNYSGQRGWKLLKIRFRVGDKYWNGSQWTTTDSTFYLSFGTTNERKPSWTYNGNSYKDYDDMSCLKWLDCMSNTDYEDKVGKSGYAIPIQKADRVCGQVQIDIYMPRMVPYDGFNYPQGTDYETWKDRQFDWYILSPVVFMKDFTVDYVYTDTSEWYMNENTNTDDLKYINETKDVYNYEKENTLKINSWQENRPIAKSFPIVNFIHGQDAGHPYPINCCEYVETMKDEFNYNNAQAQEYNIIDRQLRHYNIPTKQFTVHMKWQTDPWKKFVMNDALELDGYYIVDSQEYDIRNRNVKLNLVEYGDAKKRVSS